MVDPMSNGKQKILKVFISSTYIDLKDYRQTAITVVNRYKCVPLAMEFFMAQPEEPTKVAKKEVRIGALIGWGGVGKSALVRK